LPFFVGSESIQRKTPHARSTIKHFPVALGRFFVIFLGMELFHRILKIAIEGNASDIHIKTATPVIFRINRELIAVECP
jgi:hypothetical protein